MIFPKVLGEIGEEKGVGDALESGTHESGDFFESLGGTGFD